MVYRVTWIYQGFAATDEGWLQAYGARVAHGQVPYRDFDFVFPPLTAYKEAALVAILGANWTVFASRTLFAVEVSLAPVLAFLVLRRFTSERAAFLATLPAIFFTVIVATITSYTIDAEFFALLSVTLTINADRDGWPGRAMAITSGVAAVLAMMSKQPFLAFLFAIPFATLAGVLLRRGVDGPVHPAIASLRRSLPWYAVGVAGALVVILGYFAAAGALSGFVNEPYIVTVQANQTSLRFKLIQDLPEYITRYGALIPELLAVIVVLLAVRMSRMFELVRAGLLAVLLAFALYLTLRHPPPSRPFFVILAYGILVAAGLVALATTAALAGPWFRHSAVAGELRARLLPPEVVFLALFLQWQAQFHYDGLVFWYEGAYLSVPVVLLFLHAMSTANLRLAGPVRLGSPALASALLGAWIVIGAAGVVLERPYQDAPRSQLTATFTTPAMSGITTYPLTAQRLDGLVAQVDKRTQPGDAIYVIPDFPSLYEVTGRRNPTRVDWPNPSFLTPAIVDRMVSDLHRDPPKVVFLLNQREGDYVRNQPPIVWAGTKWAPIYDYLTAHYTQVDSVQDIKVMVPSSS